MTSDPRARRASRRRIAWHAVRAVAVIALLGAIVGCHSTVTPPESPEDPVRVFLLTDDRHNGLIMPDGRGQYIEYGYGEWFWYAENETAWYRAFPVMLWPTRGALGRRTHAAHDERSLRERLHWMTIAGFDVARAKLEPLRAELGARYQSRIDEEVYNPLFRFWFVPADDGYSLCWTCADALGRWLEALGCDISWVPVRIGLVLAE